MATSTHRRQAEKISFKLVPETCPEIDAVLDAIAIGEPITKETVESLRRLIKSKTVALRELGFRYIQSTLQK